MASGNTETDQQLQEVPQFIPECELLHEGGLDPQQLFERCKKNPGHRTFIPVTDFNVDNHLPPNYRTEEMKRYIKMLCNLTVKVIVKFTSPNRPNTYPNSTSPYPYSDYKGSKRVSRIGTGFIVISDLSEVKDGTCPCPLCEISENPKKSFLKIKVRTASHVVFDDSEAGCTVCEVFYDTEDRDKVKYLYGVKSKIENLFCFDLAARCIDDTFYVPCVTHDLDLVRQLVHGNDSSIKVPPIPLLVSHPHGRSKHITVGTFCHVFSSIPLNHSRSVVFKPFMKCRPCKDAKTSTMKSIETFLNSDGPRLSEVHILRKRLSILLPSDVNYLLCQKSDAQWVSFPQDTRFTYGDGNKSVFLPDVEFFLPQYARDFYLDGSISYYMTYDTDTCPGSSGAQLTGNGKFGSTQCLYLQPLHSGAVSDGVNKSGLYRSSVFFK